MSIVSRAARRLESSAEGPGILSWGVGREMGGSSVALCFFSVFLKTTGDE